MANRRRGEIEAILDGRAHTLCLTLGALGELETAFGKKDLLELAERFSQGRLSADEVLTLLHLGLKGAGHDFTRDEVGEMRVEGGAVGAVKLICELLHVTFGAGTEKGDPPRP